MLLTGGKVQRNLAWPHEHSLARKSPNYQTVLGRIFEILLGCVHDTTYSRVWITWARNTNERSAYDWTILRNVGQRCLRLTHLYDRTDLIFDVYEIVSTVDRSIIDSCRLDNEKDKGTISVVGGSQRVTRGWLAILWHEYQHPLSRVTVSARLRNIHVLHEEWKKVTKWNSLDFQFPRDWR